MHLGINRLRRHKHTRHRKDTHLHHNRHGKLDRQSNTRFFSRNVIGVVLDLIPRSRAGHRSLMDSFAGREDRQEANRTGCRGPYRRYIMWPMRSLVPGEDSSTGNVTGGRELARYVLEAVVGRYGCNALEAVANSARSISVASSASARELLTRFDTGQRSLPRSRCAGLVVVLIRSDSVVRRLVGGIDVDREHGNLSSAVRLFVLSPKDFSLRHVGGMPSVQSEPLHVDGGFAVGAFSFSHQGSPRSFRRV